MKLIQNNRVYLVHKDSGYAAYLGENTPKQNVIVNTFEAVQNLYCVIAQEDNPKKLSLVTDYSHEITQVTMSRVEGLVILKYKRRKPQEGKPV